MMFPGSKRSRLYYRNLKFSCKCCIPYWEKPKNAGNGKYKHKVSDRRRLAGSHQQLKDDIHGG